MKAKREFEELRPHEVLALAIDIERANRQRFETFADLFINRDEEVSQAFRGLALEEDGHRRELEERYQQYFKEIPCSVEEGEVTGVIEAVDLEDGEHLIFDDLSVLRALELALRAEREAEAFYRRAQASTTDLALKTLYGGLADFEIDHRTALEIKIAQRGGERP